MNNQQKTDLLNVAKQFITDINRALIDNAESLSVKLKTENFLEVIERMPDNLWESTTNYEPKWKDFFQKMVTKPGYPIAVIEHAFAVSIKKSLEETA